MRFLLINPALPESFWSFRWALEEVLGGKRALNPPLGLATLAALCPPHWQVTIVDENVEPLDEAPAADLIGIGGMGVQAPRQKELLQRYRAAGYRVVAGGSYASLCPEEYLELADAVGASRALEPAVLPDGHAARVVTPVFEALEPLDQDRDDVPGADGADDSTHALVLGLVARWGGW